MNWLDFSGVLIGFYELAMARRPHDVLTAFLSVAIFMVLTFGAAQSRAGDKIAKLTDQNITDFILKTTEITAGKSSDLSSNQIIEYLERHIEDGARFKSTLKYNIPGYEAQEAAMSLDKKDFIDSVKKGSESVSDYENAISIETIQISSKGDKATVGTTSTEQGMMPMSADGVTTQMVPVDGSSSCTQILTLEKGVIQMYGAQCVTTINFTPN